MNATYDAAVVGAGPAGAACARALSQAGLKTALLEASSMPRYKTCGGGLVRRAIDLLEIDAGDAIERECDEVELRLPEADLVFRMVRPTTQIAMTMRDRLDAALTEAASDAGTAVFSPRRLLAASDRNGSIDIETDRGPLRARYLVGADGAASPTARAVGLPPLPRPVPALEMELAVSDADFARLGQRARFDLGTPADGYSWVFPKSRHLSVGCLSTGENRSRLRACLESYLGTLGLTSERALKTSGFVIPVRPRSVRTRGGVLLAGDAAGLVDPVTGEGISFALLSGRLAARALIAEFDDREAATARYEELLEREICSQLRFARRLSGLLYRRPALRRWAFRRLGQPLGEALTEVHAGHRSYRDLLCRPKSWLRAALRITGLLPGARRAQRA